MSAKLNRLHPELRRRIVELLRISETATIPIEITSGWRSREAQKRLYRKPEGYPVAPPGCSTHEYGLAVDLVNRAYPYRSKEWDVVQSWLGELGQSLGLVWYPWDPVHFGLISGTDLARMLPNRCPGAF